MVDSLQEMFPVLPAKKQQILLLPNGLECLLIHDPSSDIINGAMAVKSGAFEDPDCALGLAHLTEHHILRGSKQYPPPFSLSLLLAASGGFLNAYTTSDQTCFYFEVSTYAQDCICGGGFILESILRVFASLFSCPLLDVKAAAHEIRAVDDEHNGNKSDEEKILFHGLRKLASPDHVFSRFATGNLHTLSKILVKKLRKMARAYFNKNYLPKNMTLVLKGPQSTLQLRKLVIKEFMGLSETRTNSPTKASESHHYRLDNTVFRDIDPSLLVMKAETSPQIRVCFPIYLAKHMENYRPTVRALCNLLGEESPLSLSSRLNAERKWVTSLYVSTQRLFADVEILIVKVVPTHSGWNHLGELADEILSYATVNIGESDEHDLWKLISHFEKISEFNHKSLPPFASLLDEVLNYAERLNLSSDPDLRSDIASYFETWDDMLKAPQNVRCLIKSCFSRAKVKLQVMVPHEMALEQMLSGERKHDEFYDFDYVLGDISFERTSQSQFSGRSLPSPAMTLTQLMSSRLESMAAPPTQLKVRHLEAPSQEPQLISYDRSHELWEVQSTNDDKDVIASVVVKFPQVKHTPANYVVIDLLTEVAGEELRCDMYEYEKIGCFWGLFANVNRTNSIMVTVSGPLFSITPMLDKIFALIKQIVLSVSRLPYETLKRARVAVRKKYEDQIASHNIKKVLSVSYLIMENILITPSQKVDALELIDNKVLEDFSTQVLQCPEYKSVLISGKLGEDFPTWKPLVADGNEARYAPEETEPSSTFLRPGCFYVFHTPEGPEDNMSIVMHNTQIGLRSDPDLFQFACLYRFLLSSSAVENLRIKRLLSYSVFSGIRMFQQTFGLYLLLPSGWNDCNFLTAQIEEFLLVVEEMVVSWSEDEFRTQAVDPLIESLSNEPSDESGSGLFAALQPQRGSGRRPTTPSYNEHWNHLSQVLNGSYRFQSKQCEEVCDPGRLRKLTKQDFLNFVQTLMCPRSPTRSVVVICSHPVGGADQQKRKFASQVLLHKLLSMGILVPESQILEALLKCRDTENYSDVFGHLAEASRSRKQTLAFKNLQVVAKVGALIPSLVAAWNSFTKKHHKACADSAVVNTSTTDYLQIQKENGVAPAVSALGRFEKLISIEERQNAHSDADTV